MMKLKNNWPSVALAVGILIALASNVAVTFQQNRDFLIDQLIFKERRILSKVSADLTGQGDIANIYKVQSFNSIALEIHFKTQDGATAPHIKRLILNERREGFFDFNGGVVNILVSDFNNNGKMEILTSTFTEELIPRLHIFEYDKDLDSFTQLDPQSLTNSL